MQYQKGGSSIEVYFFIAELYYLLEMAATWSAVTTKFAQKAW